MQMMYLIWQSLALLESIRLRIAAGLKTHSIQAPTDYASGTLLALMRKKGFLLLQASSSSCVQAHVHLLFFSTLQVRSKFVYLSLAAPHSAEITQRGSWRLRGAKTPF